MAAQESGVLLRAAAERLALPESFLADVLATT